MPNRTLSFPEQYKLARSLQRTAREKNSLCIDPNAWMQCFEDTLKGDPDTINKHILQSVREVERKLAKNRTAEVVGATSLKLETIQKAHTPKKYGSRTLVMGSDRNYRAKVINWFKELFKKRKAIIECFENGDWVHKLPPGFFSPGGYLRANLNPLLAPLYA